MLPELEEIAKKRKMVGLTQKELADLANVSQSLVTKVESGKMEPSYSKAKRIFEVLERRGSKIEISAEEILHKEIVSVQKSEAVSKAVQLMMDLGYSQIPVFDGALVVGSVSERTIVNLVRAGNDLDKISKQSIGEIMEEAFPQVGEKTPLSLLSNLLQVYPAVLVSRKGEVIGIISKADLLKTLL
jgi:predicted transcriptional regulator